MNKGFFRRLLALTHKEMLELLRDQSSLLMGIVLPLILILIIGYGLSLDVKNVPTAVVLEDSSPTARQFVSFTQGSEYFRPVFLHSMAEAEQKMRTHEVTAVLRVPQDFTRRLATRDATVQLILCGTESTTAMSAQGYVESSVLAWAAEQGLTSRAKGQVAVTSRIWFNDANTSTWFYLPGILMLVLTISGVFLTAVVMAREWERGTFESLFVTPVRPFEIALAKVAPYLVIGIIDIAICLFAARFLFKVPIRGSLVLIVLVSILYLLVSLLMGLLVSGVTRNQFLASQMALLVSFMPAVMFSGFVFDLRNMPGWIQPICEIFPATHFMKVAKLLFLAGNDASVVSEGVLILLGYTILFLILTTWTLRKRVE